MRDRTFLEFMDDPVDWFEEAARLARLHHAHLTEQEPEADGSADVLSPVGRSRLASTGQRPSCSVIVLDNHRRPT